MENKEQKYIAHINEHTYDLDKINSLFETDKTEFYKECTCLYLDIIKEILIHVGFWLKEDVTSTNDHTKHLNPLTKEVLEKLPDKLHIQFTGGDEFLLDKYIASTLCSLVVDKVVQEANKMLDEDSKNNQDK